MKNVNEALKNEIKNQVEVIRGVRAKINGLKWKPEAREQVAAIQARRRHEKKPTVGKAELKPFRRPETGPERAALWSDKRDESERARYLMLAYGALRGRTYAQIESKCREDNKPSAYRLAQEIRSYELTAGSWTIGAWTEKTAQAWLDGSPPVLTWKKAIDLARQVSAERASA